MTLFSLTQVPLSDNVDATFMLPILRLPLMAVPALVTMTALIRDCLGQSPTGNIMSFPSLSFYVSS